MAVVSRNGTHPYETQDALPCMQPKPDVAGHAPDDLSDGDFAAVARMVHRETGIVITAAKKSMLVSRLSRRLRSLGVTSFSDYVALLRGPAGEAERRALVSAVTTNVTGFFREPHHFKALHDLGGGLVERARGGGRVRLWSAGCSTGQEAFSMAATLLALAPDLARHDLRILATDIDPVVIETARIGSFDHHAVGERPPAQLSRFLKDGPALGKTVVSQELQELIRFEELNLLSRWPFQGNFDVIFCRNVVIYFDLETRRDLWMRFAGRMTEGGMLFIGHSERMDPKLDPFFEPVGITQYRRTGQRVPAGASAAEPISRLQGE